jgi:hypothetical protein
MRVSTLGRVLGVLMALGTLSLVSACKQGSVADPISREEYIDVYVQILQAAAEEPDSVAATERAREILASHGVSEDDLLTFARNHADNAEYLVEIWSEIENRLRNPEEPDSTATTEPEADEPYSEIEG